MTNRCRECEDEPVADELTQLGARCYAEIGADLAALDATPVTVHCYYTQCPNPAVDVGTVAAPRCAPCHAREMAAWRAYLDSLPEGRLYDPWRKP